MEEEAGGELGRQGGLDGSEFEDKPAAHDTEEPKDYLFPLDECIHNCMRVGDLHDANLFFLATTGLRILLT